MPQIAESRPNSKSLASIYLNRIPEPPDRRHVQRTWLGERFAFPSASMADLVAELAFGGGTQ